MLSNHKIIEEQVVILDRDTDLAELNVGDSRLGFGIIMTMAGFVGAWGFMSLVNGIIQANNIAELGKGFITAATGL